ncbi:Uncharacterized conserved protein YbjT, contains NAD(P)-binding and DUF2867 domains [Chitinophaga rupis]|uniref:Uncharacterized conserved protein YbjT, contains NAD(P)-binding and DUF2867 domains n=1 Tax=Chitinophaga rupis TaxID=573321 RepID=A0A1H7T2B4_9BACT|nr:SDR family oxidoreductase [Chitinophaga rupis]SEL78649.1 Uncharacterized conserved protein YbjT, contains NAD(P)-binding and DUF2867 domains [Chitinophaga rupis]
MSANILITGATGNIGSELAKQLSAQGVPFRAMVRSLKGTEALAALSGATLVTGDLNDPASLQQALQGIEKAFLLTSSSEQAETQQLNFVKAAQEAGVRHIVKLSQFAAAKDSPVRFLRYHAVVEEAIQRSGMAYTFLRPNLFMQGLLGFRDTIVHKSAFFAAIGNAKISMVDIRDIAAVAAAALTSNKHHNKIYDLTGPAAITHAEMAAQLSNVLGRTIQFIDVTPAEMRHALDSVGFPAWQADGLIEDYAHYARGEAAVVANSIEEVTDRPARDFGMFARDYAGAFK